MMRKALGTAGLIVLLGGIHLATLRDGQEWGDDFSLYVAHARNIVEGRAYADTGYIYNSSNPILSPRSYPPVFPLLLAPVYGLFGLDLGAMKVFVVLLFMALLGVLAVLYCTRLPFSLSLTCLVLLALNPYVWQHKDRLLSETPFMLFAYLALLLAEKALAMEAPKTRGLAWGLLAGLAAYLAFGTRTVGIVLIPSILGCALLRQRRLGPASLAITGAFAAGVIVQKTILVLDGSYLDQVHFDLMRLASNSLSLVKGMGLLMNNGLGRVACILLYAVLLGLAGLGYAARLRNGATVYEWFIAFYCLLLVLWPPFDTAVLRYLMPILPLWFLYIGEGLCLLDSILSRRATAVATPALALAVLLSYADWFRNLDAGPIRNGVNAPEAVALFDWIKENTDLHDVFLFQKPRAFALYTRRRSLAHHKADDPLHLARTLREYGVTHVVIHPSSPFDFFQNSSRLVEALRAEGPTGFEKVYENPGFRVYRLRAGAFTLSRDCQSGRQSRN
jgi:hypothetical protein